MRKLWSLRAIGRLGWVCAALWFGVILMNPAPRAGSCVPRALDQVLMNVPHPPATPVRQTGSVFGLTLRQQARIAHPAAASAAETTHGAPVPVPGPSGASERPERSMGSPGEEMGRKGKPAVYTYEAPGLPLCPECGVRPVIFYCRSHLKALCLECIVRHDRAPECVYVPGWRGEKSEAD
jgi:hypothetical protein